MGNTGAIGNVPPYADLAAVTIWVGVLEPLVPARQSAARSTLIYQLV